MPFMPWMQASPSWPPCAFTGRRPPEFDPAVGDERPGLAALTEAKFLELHQHIRGEVAVRIAVRMSAGRSPDWRRS
jgi:hypothetical protein